MDQTLETKHFIHLENVKLLHLSHSCCWIKWSVHLNLKRLTCLWWYHKKCVKNMVFMQQRPTLGLFLLITHNDFSLVSQC